MYDFKFNLRSYCRMVLGFFCSWLKNGNFIFDTRNDDDTRFHWCIFSLLYDLILYGNAYRRNISYYVYTCKNSERSVISVISTDMNYAFILLLTCHILSSAVFIPFWNGRAIAPFSMDFRCRYNYVAIVYTNTHSLTPAIQCRKRIFISNNKGKIQSISPQRALNKWWIVNLKRHPETGSDSNLSALKYTLTMQ